MSDEGGQVGGARALSEKPKRGEKVRCNALRRSGAGGPGNFWNSIRQNFGPNPDKANTNLWGGEEAALECGVGKEGGGRGAPS